MKPGISLRRYAYLVLVLSTLLMAVPPVAAQSQPVVIVVRDGVGNPMFGVPLVLYVAGPPHEEFDNCVTDERGECSLVIPPGAYIVTFIQGWRGREFIPLEEQNGGSMTDGGVGGFGFNLEPSNEVQIISFVIGQRDGRLVPIWDMSRDMSAPPAPFIYSANGSPEGALDGIDLTALSTAIPRGQIVTEEAPSVNIPATAEVNPPADVATTGQASSTPLLLIVLGVGVLTAGIALTGWWLMRQSEKRGQ